MPLHFDKNSPEWPRATEPKKAKKKAAKKAEPEPEAEPTE